MKAVLLLEDGRKFVGEGFGSEGTTVGEVVFNTGMTGYQEILTDPSYKGQMVTMTYPHIGNYGINTEDVESVKPQAEALIVRELCRMPSNYRSSSSLHDYLKKHNVLGIHQIDTRALTRHIRKKGAMMGILSTEIDDEAELKTQLSKHPNLVGQDMVQHVTSSGTSEWQEAADPAWYHKTLPAVGEIKFRVAAFDFGMKHNIPRLMTSLGMEVTIVSATTPAGAIKELNPDGIFLSNGPGDPEGVPYAIETISQLVKEKPIFGICLGHQLLGLSMGATSFKLKFGHHGCNHPVKNLATGEIEITSQNHNFALDTKSLEKAGFKETHRNLNDQTLEGIKHCELPLCAVQYHPEASPGPHDSHYLFKEFYQLMEETK